jgi:phosphocarrier protein HPr
VSVADAIPPSGERTSGEAMVQDPTGLHARPAVRLTKLAKRFEADIRVRAGSGDWVNAKSPNRVMKLKARHGELLRFEAEGPDASDAMRALVGLVERNFDE